jgi:type II secretion system protein H
MKSWVANSKRRRAAAVQDARATLKAPASALRPGLRQSSGALAFTLVELILVLALLTIVTSLAAPSLTRFFRGRDLDSEARRLLSLSHAGQSRAVSSGFPMLLWIDSQGSAYGLQEEGTVQNGKAQDVDPKAEEFQLNDRLHVEAVNASPVPVNGHSLPAIRFLPDGQADETSPTSIRLTSDNGESLWLIQLTNRLSYEIRNTDK